MARKRFQKSDSQETEANGEGVTPPGSTTPAGDGVTQLPPLLTFFGAPVHATAGLGLAVTTYRTKVPSTVRCWTDTSRSMNR